MVSGDLVCPGALSAPRLARPAVPLTLSQHRAPFRTRRICIGTFDPLFLRTSDGAFSGLRVGSATLHAGPCAFRRSRAQPAVQEDVPEVEQAPVPEYFRTEVRPVEVFLACVAGLRMVWHESVAWCTGSKPCVARPQTPKTHLVAPVSPEAPIRPVHVTPTSQIPALVWSLIGE